MKIKSEPDSVEKLLKDFERTSDEFFSFDEFKRRLSSGKRLKIKYGVDVTASFMHIGHAVNLWMMRKMQELGHHVIFLIGDFTTLIGDPTGKSSTRPIISENTIESNAQEFIKQISNVLITDDPDVFSIRRNSEWYGNMPVSEFLSLLSMVTHNRLISRDMFQKRIEEHKDIYMHEMVYPILQGYDSKMLDADLTIVGSDQLFNEMMGKFYQEKFGQDTQIIITTKITPGLDGVNKQSKSLNNYIAITDTPKDKFGKAMSMPDAQVIQWLEVYTDLPLEEVRKFENSLRDGENPREIKLKLAYLLVEKYHGEKTANEELDWFIMTFSKKKFPENSRVINLDKGVYKLIDLLLQSDDQKSKSDYKRLIKENAVRVNGEKSVDANALLTVEENTELAFSVGKKTYFIIKAK